MFESSVPIIGSNPSDMPLVDCYTCDYRVVCRGGCVAAALAHTGTRHENSYCHRAVARFPYMATKAL